MPLSSGLLDYSNKSVLAEYAGKIEKNHIYPLFNKYPDDENKGFLAKLKSYFPTPFSFGESIGWMIGLTHSQEYSNFLIEKVVKWTFADQIAAEEVAKTTLSWSQRLIQWFRSDIAQPGLIEAAKLALTPTVAPLVTIGLGIAGGITFTAGAMVIQYLASSILGKRAKDVTIHDLPKVATLIKREKGKLLLGQKELSEQGLANISFRINQYSLCKELQKMKKEEVKNFLLDRIFFREDGKLILKDGYVLSEKDKAAIDTSICLLKEDNPTHESKEIKKMIKLFSLHIPNFKENSDHTLISSEGILYKIGENNTAFRN